MQSASGEPVPTSVSTGEPQTDQVQSIPIPAFRCMLSDRSASAVALLCSLAVIRRPVAPVKKLHH